MSAPASIKCLKQSKKNAMPSLIAFLHIRNEEDRILHVLDHHRQLGIQEFYIVDNMSTDNTRSILESENDVNLFLSTQGFSDSRFGMTVMNPLLDEFGSGKWCLMVDADEYFVYPHCEHKSLKTLTRYLDRKNCDSMLTLMIDMYGEKAIRDTIIPRDGKPVDVCNYFDKEHYYKIKSGTFPFVEFRGGPRMRAFWSESDGFHPPTISKVPFVKWSKGMRYVSVAHYMRPSPKRLADITGALLHFKYLSDFHNRAKTEVERQQHFAGAREYKKYLEKLEKDPNLSLFHQGSIRYYKSSDLVRAGLCATSSEWGLFI